MFSFQPNQMMGIMGGMPRGGVMPFQPRRTPFMGAQPQPINPSQFMQPQPQPAMRRPPMRPQPQPAMRRPPMRPQPVGNNTPFAVLQGSAGIR